MGPLITNLNTPSPSTRPSPLSSNVRMPHVFVVPPEEEQQSNPPWCCFDADQQPENSGDFPSDPDIHFLDVPYILQQSELEAPLPIASRTLFHQPRPRVPIPKKLEKKQRPEAVKIIEHKSSRPGYRDIREDSDVIEVIKVKRGRENFTDLEVNIKAKRSRTLKARATKALQSIKNVSKGSHRTHVKDLWTSSEGMPKTFGGMQQQHHTQEVHRPPATFSKKGSLSRAASRSISQIFQPMKPSRIESPYTAPSVASTDVHHILPIAYSSSLLHLESTNTNLCLNQASSSLMTNANDTPHQSEPSIPSAKNIITRFSVRDLHRLFSFSSPSPDDPSSSPTSMVASPSFAHSGCESSTFTSHCLSDVPSEEDLFADAYFIDVESPDQMLAQTRHTGHEDGIPDPRRLSDFSFEMRLDSLHFDSLSFDLGDFHVPKEGQDLR